MTTDATPPDSDALPDGTHVGRTALRVGDAGETAEFYQSVVGLEVTARAGASVSLGAGERTLLVLEEDEDAPARRPSGTGLYHTAFRVPTRAALGDAVGRIRDAWRLDGAADHGVSEAVYLTDPEGNGVEVYRDRPREEWPIAPDGQVLMGTDPLDVDAVEAAGDGRDRAPAGTDVGHVHLEVSSLPAFREFYVDTLGFEERAAVRRASFVAAGGYHHHVGANTWNGRSNPVEGRGLSWFEVVVPAGEGVDALRGRLDDQGVSVTETDEGLVVTDPDGIEIRLRVESP